jgi:hypothetical protein
MPDLDLAEQFETVQSFTKGGTSDSELRSQLTLRRNAGLFWQAASDI